MDYIKKIPEDPTIKQKGLNGYTLNLSSKDISISVEDVFEGHDRYCINRRSSHIYYVLEGSGEFKINGFRYSVDKDDVVEIMPNTEFVFAGKMKLLLIMTPAFNTEDNIEGRKNDLYIK